MKKILLIIFLSIVANFTTLAQVVISDEILQDTIDLWIQTNNTKAITAAKLNTILTYLNTNKLHVDSASFANADSAATGLEKITEGGQTGWRLIGRNPLYYGNIGNEAIDFSYSNTNSSAFGATGAYSFAFGYKNKASNSYTFAGGSNSSATENNSFAFGDGVLSSGEGSFAIGGSTLSYGGYSFSGGAGTGITYYTTASGEVSFNYSQSSTKSSNAAANNSVILGGVDNVITAGANKSGIFVGNLNTIGALGVQSAIIGGDSITLNLPDVVAVPRLMIAKDETLPTGSYTGTLARDTDDSLYYYFGSSWHNLTDIPTDVPDLWTSDGTGNIKYPKGSTFNALAYQGDDSAVFIQIPYVGDVFRKPYAEGSNFDVKAIHLTDSLFRLIATPENQIRASSYRGNPDSMNLAIASNWQVKTLVIDTLVTMTGNWTLPDSITIKKTTQGLITGSHTITGDGTVIEVGDESLFNTNVTLAGTWQAENPYITWFGAVGNGITDDYIAFNKFLNFLDICDYKTAYLSADKTYYIGDEVAHTIVAPINIDGNDATILGKYTDLVANADGIIVFIGAADYTKNVAADLVKGSRYIQVDNNTDIEVGMGIRVVGGIFRDTYNVFVQSIVDEVISTDSIRILDPIPFDIPTSDISGTDIDFFTVHPVTLKNITFIAEGSYTTKRFDVLQIWDCFYPDFENLTFNPVGYLAQKSVNAYGGYFFNIKAFVPEGSEPDYFGAYGLMASGNVNCTYDNIFARGSAHAITFTGNLGYGNRVLNSDFYALDGGTGIDAHSILDLNIYNCRTNGLHFAFGNIVADNCDITLNGSNSIHSDREDVDRGFLNLTIQNSRFYIDNIPGAVGADATYILYRDATITDTANYYKIVNNTIYNEDDNLYLTNVLTETATPSIIFESNRFYGGNVLPGNYVTLKNNYYNDVKLFENEAPSDYYNLVNNTTTISLGTFTMGGLDEFSIIGQFKLKRSGSSTLQYLWGSSATKLALGWRDDNKTFSFNYRSSSLKNFSSSFVWVTPDTLWHTMAAVMDVMAEDTAYNVYIDGLPAYTVNFPITYTGSTTYNFTTPYFADYSGTVAGTVKGTDSSHGLSTGDRITISSSTNYNGTYYITVIDANNFYFTHSYVAEGAGAVWKRNLDVWDGVYATGNLEVGSNGGTTFNKGSMNSFAVYDRALTLQEISDYSYNPNLLYEGALLSVAGGKSPIKWYDNSPVNLDLTVTQAAHGFTQNNDNLFVTENIGVNGLLISNSTYRKTIRFTLADDAEYDLPSGSVSHGALVSNVAGTSYSYFDYDVNGVVTLDTRKSGDASSTGGIGDVGIKVLDDGDHVTIRNQLGSSQDFYLDLLYVIP
jgi:hypothetical protein